MKLRYLTPEVLREAAKRIVSAGELSSGCCLYCSQAARDAFDCECFDYAYEEVGKLLSASGAQTRGNPWPFQPLQGKQLQTARVIWLELMALSIEDGSIGVEVRQ